MRSLVAYGTRDDNPLLMEAVWDTEVTYSLMVDWNNSPIYDGDVSCAGLYKLKQDY